MNSIIEDKNHGDEKFVFEFFDRKRKVVCIGTFIQLCDRDIADGQMFIVPTVKSYNNCEKIGCIEGREDSIGYMLPIALYAKSSSNTNIHHIQTKNGRAWIRDRCFIEIE